jgi:hypothetical protein
LMVKFCTLAGARGLVVAERLPKPNPGMWGLVEVGGAPKEGSCRALLLVEGPSPVLQGKEQEQVLGRGSGVGPGRCMRQQS